MPSRADHIIEVLLQTSAINEHDLRHLARLALLKLLLDDECERSIRIRFDEARATNRCVLFGEIWEIIFMRGCSTLDRTVQAARSLNTRSISYITRLLSEFFRYEFAPPPVVSSLNQHRITTTTGSYYMSRLSHNSAVFDFSGLYRFAKQIYTVFANTGLNEMSIDELESAYVRTFKHGLVVISNPKQQMSQIKSFPARALGFVESSLLLGHGLSLMMSIKKLRDIRICVLNRDFRDPKF